MRSPDSDRENAHFVGEPQRDGLDAEPINRDAAAIIGQDEIATFERFDSDVAGRCLNYGTRHEADRVTHMRDRDVPVPVPESALVFLIRQKIIPSGGRAFDDNTGKRFAIIGDLSWPTKT